MKSQRLSDGERILAVFIDFENLALGFGGRRDRFSIEKVLERLVEKGKIVCKKAYADWSRFGYYTQALHEAAVELIEIPKRVITGKNSADIRMCVDAMDLAYSKDHIDTFVIVSGDSDFSPLVSKLKELGRDVIGLGLADSTSNLLRDNCDEFIYYEDLDRAPLISVGEDESIPEAKRKMFALLLDSLLALRRENKELIFSSMVKDTMKRKKPSFNEEYHGYRTFSELLEEAQTLGILDLEKHKNSGGTYVVTRFGSEPRMVDGRPVPVVLHPPMNGGRGPRALPPLEPARKPMLPAPREPMREPQSRDVPPPREPMREPPRRDPVPDVAPVRPPVAEVPAPRRVVTLPPKPPAPPRERERAPARDRGPDRNRGPARAEDERQPMGRELIEEADVFDDEDAIPSYMPRKAPPKPPAAEPVAAAPPAVELPNAPPPKKRATSPMKPGTKPVRNLDAPKAPKPEAAEKPAATAERPAAKPEKTTREPADRKPAPAPTPRPVAPHAPKLDDADGFGAGLDD